VHISERGKKITDPKEAFKEGETIEAQVIHVSSEDHKLGLSIKQQQKEEAKKQAATAGGSNLGDLIKQKMEEEGM
jgi:small subunit ribosomal protein S1